MVRRRRFLRNTPHSDGLWRGLGGYFDSLVQIVSEFVDNSVASILATAAPNRDIAIHFVELSNSVRVSVEDTGSGIAHLDNAFTLGGKDDRQGPLNEHGFGMKHALAAANPKNDAWSVSTRTADDFTHDTYTQVAAPYNIPKLPLQVLHTRSKPWPGRFNTSGTFIEFACSREMFDTLRTGMPGQPRFATCIGYLIEDLGFIYAGLIKDNAASFTVSWSSKDSQQGSKAVAAVVPDWEEFYDPRQGSEKIDLGRGEVTLKYSFGAMKVSKYRKYYKRNMSSSGLEIRLNGRVLAHNLFKEVWNIECHNMYNHILVTVDLATDRADRLPPTRTAKNGLRQGDPELERLYEWVRRHMPRPKKQTDQAHDEADLFDILRGHKEKHVPDPKTVTTDQYVFTTLNEKVKVDMYVTFADQVWLYEGKKDVTTVKDVYQLRMYWDGASLDDLRPTKGILIASRHPDSVARMIEHTNSMRDIHGRPYNFELKTWQEEGVSYPN